MLAMTFVYEYFFFFIFLVTASFTTFQLVGLSITAGQGRFGKLCVCFGHAERNVGPYTDNYSFCEDYGLLICYTV
jgi:hypothetical protein